MHKKEKCIKNAIKSFLYVALLSWGPVVSPKQIIIITRYFEAEVSDLVDGYEIVILPCFPKFFELAGSVLVPPAPEPPLDLSH